MFEMAYHRDPLKCTLRVFENRLEALNRLIPIFNGTFTKEMRTECDIERLNNEIVVKMAFPTIFPPEPDTEEDDG